MNIAEVRLSRPLVVWTAWVVAALLLLSLVGGWWYAAAVVVSGAAVAMVPGVLPSRVARPVDSTRDLLAVAVFYLGVIALMRLAFVGFTTDRTAGLFLSFAGALLLGVVGPVIFTVWIRHGSLRDLGIRRDHLRSTLALAVLFGGVQFALTLWGYALPAPVDWVPLLAMALVVGVFESVFFRGFIQNRLEAHFGPIAGIGGAAVLYGAYHVGYGMGIKEIGFLTGLGVTYAVAFAVARNLLVLWPLLTPLGSFYAQLDNGDIHLPWASIAGFADVLVIMVAVAWIAHRHERRRSPAAAPSATAAPTASVRA